MKKLLTATTALAIAFTSVIPAQAQSLPSWETVIAKAKAADKAGKYYGAMRGKHSNAVFRPLAGADGFLFGNVLADDVPLPRVTDVRKVLNAAKQQNKPIIVASNNWILPSNMMLCEIAEQVKMDCAEFTRLFYMYLQKDDDGNYVGDDKAYETLAEIQAEFVKQLDSMGIIELVSEGKSAQIIALENTIKALEADAETNAATIASLKQMISDLESDNEDLAEKLHGKEIALLAEEAKVESLNAANETLQSEKAALETAVANKQAEIDELAQIRDKAKKSLEDAGIEPMETLQDMINALVNARDALQAQIKLLPEEFESVQAIIDTWNAQKVQIENYKEALGEYATAAEAFQAGVDSVLEEDGLTWDQINDTMYILADANTGTSTLVIQEDGINQTTVDSAVQAAVNAVTSSVTTPQGLVVTKDGHDYTITLAENYVLVPDTTILNDQDATHNADSIDNLTATVDGNEVTISLAENYKIVHESVIYTKAELDEAVSEVDFQENVGYNAYDTEDGSWIQFQLKTTNHKKKTFKVTAKDFTEDGFHLSFQNNGSAFNFDVQDNDYVELINSLKDVYGKDEVLSVINVWDGQGLNELLDNEGVPYEGLPQHVDNYVDVAWTHSSNNGATCNASNSNCSYVTSQDGLTHTISGFYYNDEKVTSWNNGYNEVNFVPLTVNGLELGRINKLMKEVAEMSFEHGYDEGYNDGYEDGYDQGWDDALANVKADVNNEVSYDN